MYGKYLVVLKGERIDELWIGMADNYDDAKKRACERWGVAVAPYELSSYMLSDLDDWIFYD